MRVLILTDPRFAVDEQPMLSRLEVGLADEGVRVVHAVPRRVASWAHAHVFTRQVEYEDRGSSWSLRWRVAQLVRALSALDDEPAGKIDVVHAWGEGAWSTALDLSAALGASVVLEVWRRSCVAPAAELRQARSGEVALLTCEPALERALRDAGTIGPVRTVPWGVHAAGSARTILTREHATSIVLLASGRDRAAIDSALTGLSAAAPHLGDFLVFAATEAIERPGLWARLKELGLLERVTLIPDLEARRDLMLEADILILPEALGEQRSTTLDAMGHSMLVLATTDSDSSVLSEGRTARLLERNAAPARWREVLCWAMDRPDDARDLARSAWEFVRTQRRASAHVAGVLNAYDWLISTDAIPLRAGGDR